MKILFMLILINSIISNIIIFVQIWHVHKTFKMAYSHCFEGTLVESRKMTKNLKLGYMYIILHEEFHIGPNIGPLTLILALSLFVRANMRDLGSM